MAYGRREMLPSLPPSLPPPPHPLLSSLPFLPFLSDLQEDLTILLSLEHKVCYDLKWYGRFLKCKVKFSEFAVINRPYRSQYHRLKKKLHPDDINLELQGQKFFSVMEM